MLSPGRQDKLFGNATLVVGSRCKEERGWIGGMRLGDGRGIQACRRVHFCSEIEQMILLVVIMERVNFTAMAMFVPSVNGSVYFAIADLHLIDVMVNQVGSLSMI